MEFRLEAPLSVSVSKKMFINKTTNDRGAKKNGGWKKTSLFNTHQKANANHNNEINNNPRDVVVVQLDMVR